MFAISQNKTSCFACLCLRKMTSPRFTREIMQLKLSPPTGISCVQVEDSQKNLLLASMMGPVGSAYDKGVFELELIVTERYPFEPPRVRYLTPIHHPNVDTAGRICLDMLKMPPTGAWRPTFTIEGVLLSIQSLMANPNPDDPLMPDIASQYKYNKEEFIKQAQAFTLKHACTNSVSVNLSPTQKSSKHGDKRSNENDITTSTKRLKSD